MGGCPAGGGGGGVVEQVPLEPKVGFRVGGVGNCLPTHPLCPSSREGSRRIHSAVVREEAGPADWGNGLHVQGRLLGGQGEAGLAHVPQHLLSTTPPTKIQAPALPGPSFLECTQFNT